MSRRYKQLEDNRLEHRVIMEDALGFKLPKEFVVHHINGDKKDNRLENLAIMTYKAHALNGSFIKAWKSARDAQIETGFFESNINSGVAKLQGENKWKLRNEI